MLNQNFQEPFVAIVIDPVRTISAGKVCLGAFRTYPKVKIKKLSYLLALLLFLNFAKLSFYLMFDCICLQSNLCLQLGLLNQILFAT